MLFAKHRCASCPLLPAACAGEYAALASVVELLSVAGLVSLVFLRGMVMQGERSGVASHPGLLCGACGAFGVPCVLMRCALRCSLPCPPGAVPRDELGRSDFGMVACNPSRVGPFLNDRVLVQLVQAISK